MHVNILRLCTEIPCGPILYANEAPWVVGWTLTALATPYPVLWDFTGVREVESNFWHRVYAGMEESAGMMRRVRCVGLNRAADHERLAVLNPSRPSGASCQAAG